MVEFIVVSNHLESEGKGGGAAAAVVETAEAAKDAEDAGLEIGENKFVEAESKISDEMRAKLPVSLSGCMTFHSLITPLLVNV